MKGALCGRYHGSWAQAKSSFAAECLARGGMEAIGGCNVPQMGGSPVSFRCAKIRIFGEYGVSGRGECGRGAAGAWALGALGVLDFLEETPFSCGQLLKTNDL